MSSITIRELAAFDRRAVAFAFGRLSERSRYQRYFTAKPALTPRELASLVDIDHWHHEAMIAFAPPPGYTAGFGTLEPCGRANVPLFGLPGCSAFPVARL